MENASDDNSPQLPGVPKSFAEDAMERQTDTDSGATACF
jgi:hypothetical protein